MQRRSFLGGLLAAAMAPIAAAEAALRNKMFIIRLRAVDGRVGNVTIMARDSGAAVAQVKKKYPGCQILGIKER